MSITLDLRQAVIHKVHDSSEADLRSMIEGSVDGPEQALPGLGVIFEMIWKNIDTTKQNDLVHVANEHLKHITPGPLS
ncbi:MULTISPECIES: small acid-soluble spore protein SspI [Paenibacillus]|uniref:Small, acid-soluble spore protein I n=1 Tax=Paenibacillus albilobatus TaxID=2716884 RepID=A0A919XGA9_9BACL|nr:MULTISPECIES: small acid-soluble spore protein SspI [Paenibacillus]MDR9855909.1 small acid-soluble spore protein SspI [Paenibacillus sp. VCA1]GIO32074.1 small, acid-soluble spore protein I [Paenibacillus albilobatus]